MDAEIIKREIIDLIAKDQLDQAVNLLKEYMPTNHPDYISLVMQMRRLNELKNKTINATIALDEASLERNKISMSLFELTKALDEPPAKAEIKFEADHQPSSVVQEKEPLQAEEPKTIIPPSSGSQLKGYQKEVSYSGSPSAEEKTVLINKPYSIVFRQCVQAVNLNKFKLQQENEVTGYLQAKTGFSIWSVGEQIHVFVKELETNKTQVHIISDSTVSTTLTTWGRNSKNIEQFLQTLRQL